MVAAGLDLGGVLRDVGGAVEHRAHDAVEDDDGATGVALNGHRSAREKHQTSNKATHCGVSEINGKISKENWVFLFWILFLGQIVSLLERKEKLEIFQCTKSSEIATNVQSEFEEFAGKEGGGETV